MNVLELKGSLHELIARVDDVELLSKFYGMAMELIQQQPNAIDFWDELSQYEQKELEQALKESKDQNNLIAHHEVMQKYSRWIK